MGSVKRAALYFRVSTEDQDCKNQVPDLHRYCEFRGWINAEEFYDDAVSGTKTTRPDLERLMAKIRHGKFDVLLVWSYDRFARSVMHLIQTMDQLKVLGVDFVSYREQVDTTTAEGKLMFHFYAALAEFERNRIATRTRAALRRLQDQGIKLGRPSENRPDIIQATLDLRGTMSYRDIAKQVGMSTGWVFNILKRSEIPPHVVA